MASTGLLREMRLTMTTPPFVEPMTRSTRPVSAWVPVGIGLIEQMPAHTMRSLYTDDVSSQHVLSVGNRLKVLWINANRIAAKMVEFFIWGNGPNGQLVRHTVCQMGSGAIPEPSVILGVISTTERPLPQPARIGFADVLPESVLGRIRKHRKITPFGVVQRAVIAAPLPCIVA